MAKSSINFQKVSTHSFKHNDRTEDKTAKTVFSEFSHLNICDTNSKTAYENFNKFYDDAVSKVTGRTRRAKRENTLIEASVNIKPNTTLEDLKILQKHIEKEFGFTGLQIAIHRDEGHFEKDKFITNQHAHLSFFTLDKNTGRQMFRVEHISKEKLSNLQTKTAEILNMERGVDARISKRKRLDHKTYKAVKKEELAKQKDLKTEIKKLREQLQEQKATRQDYAELEQLNRELKERIRNKDLTIAELQHELEQKSKIVDSISVADILNQSDTDYENVINELKTQNKLLEDKNLALNKKINSRANMSDLNTNFELEQELETHIKNNFETVEVKTGVLKSEKRKYIKPTNSFFEKTIDIIAKGYHSLKARYEDLKERFAELKQDNQKLTDENIKQDLYIKELRQDNTQLKNKLFAMQQKHKKAKEQDIDYGIDFTGENQQVRKRRK